MRNQSPSPHCIARWTEHYASSSHLVYCSFLLDSSLPTQVHREALGRIQAAHSEAKELASSHPDIARELNDAMHELAQAHTQLLELGRAMMGDDGPGVGSHRLLREGEAALHAAIGHLKVRVVLPFCTHSSS
jgi:hypothetical protein